MDSNNNSTFEKNSFLQGANISFIKELYLQYLNNPESIPEGWSRFFDGLDEDHTVVEKEISGPSWAPIKNKKINLQIKEKDLSEDKKEVASEKLLSQKNL